MRLCIAIDFKTEHCRRAVTLGVGSSGILAAIVYVAVLGRLRKPRRRVMDRRAGRHARENTDAARDAGTEERPRS